MYLSLRGADDPYNLKLADLKPSLANMPIMFKKYFIIVKWR